MKILNILNNISEWRKKHENPTHCLQDEWKVYYCLYELRKIQLIKTKRNASSDRNENYSSEETVQKNLNHSKWSLILVLIRRFRTRIMKSSADKYRIASICSQEKTKSFLDISCSKICDKSFYFSNMKHLIFFFMRNKVLVLIFPGVT